MKFAWQTIHDTLAVTMRGELETRTCRCLQNFWDMKVLGSKHIVVDMDEVDASDGSGTAVMVSLLQRSLHEGATITLKRAPQMLAHTLYKIGLLQDGRLALDAPREGE